MRNDEDDIDATKMSLRDYFAAAAMQALIQYAGTADGVENTKQAMSLVPSSAFQMADAMLAERSK